MKNKTQDLGKIKELKLELIKARAGTSKGGSKKVRDIKKMIARIYTLNKPIKKEEKSSGELNKKNK